MATFIKETDYWKIAKILIFNHDRLWVLLNGDYALSIKDFILSRVRYFGIEQESQLYRDIDYSICTKESIKDRNIYYSDIIIICDVDELINETITVTSSCNKVYVGTVR